MVCGCMHAFSVRVPVYNHGMIIAYIVKLALQEDNNAAQRRKIEHLLNHGANYCAKDKVWMGITMKYCFLGGVRSWSFMSFVLPVFCVAIGWKHPAPSSSSQR